MGSAWLRRVLPDRQRRVGALLVFALIVVGTVVALGALVGVSAATAALGAWGLVVAGLRELFALWRPIHSLPRLDVSLHHDGTAKTELVLERSQAVRPIDRRAIVSEQSDVARETVEARPATERRSLWEPINPDLRESYDDALDHFRCRLEEFSRQLGAWLVAYESRRWPTASYVEAWVRVENSGEAPAEDLMVELALPDGLMRATERPAIDPPPDPPRFQRRHLIGSVEPPAPLAGAGHMESKLGNVSGPDWVTEDGSRVARYRIQKLLHGTRDFSAYPLRLVAREAGRFEMAWSARASNLDAPAHGVFVVDARPQPRSDEPVRALSELVDTDEVEIRKRRLSPST